MIHHGETMHETHLQFWHSRRWRESARECKRERERPRECDLDLTAFMPVLRLCSEARLQVLRSWCRQQAKHIPFDGQKGSGALRILPGWPPNWLWGSWCTALNRSKTACTQAPSSKSDSQSSEISPLPDRFVPWTKRVRNGYETGTKRDEGSILVGGHCFKMSVCTFHLLAAWLEHCWDLCLPSLRLPISDDLLTLGRWGHRASNGNKT